MGVAALSFWLTDKAIKPATYPTAEALLVHAWGKFRQFYIKECATYDVFLQRVFADIETHEVHYSTFVDISNYLTAVYSRAYLILYKHRRKCIDVFKRSDNFDTEAAAFLLRQCERRIERASRTHYSLSTYKQLADIANRLKIFDPFITGEQLMRLHDGTPGMPLYTSNAAKAVFFLSMLSQNGHLPHNWKTKVERNGLLISTRTGKAVDAKYMRGVAYQYNVIEYKCVKVQEKSVLDIGTWGEIARSVKNVTKNP